MATQSMLSVLSARYTCPSIFTQNRWEIYLRCMVTALMCVHCQCHNCAKVVSLFRVTVTETSSFNVVRVTEFVCVTCDSVRTHVYVSPNKWKLQSGDFAINNTCRLKGKHVKICDAVRSEIRQLSEERFNKLSKLGVGPVKTSKQRWQYVALFKHDHKTCEKPLTYKHNTS